MVQRALGDADVGRDRVEARARTVRRRSARSRRRRRRVPSAAAGTIPTRRYAHNRNGCAAVGVAEDVNSLVSPPPLFSITLLAAALSRAGRLAPGASHGQVDEPSRRRATSWTRPRAPRRSTRSARSACTRCASSCTGATSRRRAKLAREAEVRRHRPVGIRLVALPARARRGQGSRLERAAHAERAGAALGDQRRARHTVTRPSPNEFRMFVDGRRRSTSATTSRRWSIWNEPNHPDFLRPQYARQPPPGVAEDLPQPLLRGAARLHRGRASTKPVLDRRDGAARHRQGRGAADLPARRAVPEQPLPAGRAGARSCRPPATRTTPTRRARGRSTSRPAPTTSRSACCPADPGAGPRRAAPDGSPSTCRSG